MLQLPGDFNTTSCFTDFTPQRVKELKKTLDNIIKHHPHKKLAVVFDIDDTLIFSKTGHRHPYIYQLYQYALQNQLHIFFITARLKNEGNVIYTKNQLEKTGFGLYHRLYMLPYHYLVNRSIGLYKFHTRQFLESQGQTIILNVGDLWTDLLFPIPNALENYKKNNYVFQVPNKIGLNIKLPYLG